MDRVYGRANAFYFAYEIPPDIIRQHGLACVLRKAQLFALAQQLVCGIKQLFLVRAILFNELSIEFLSSFVNSETNKLTQIKSNVGF